MIFFLKKGETQLPDTLSADTKSERPYQRYQLLIRCFHYSSLNPLFQPMLREVYTIIYHLQRATLLLTNHLHPRNIDVILSKLYVSYYE